jgi:glycosyltransferase involved in cell wall biosynthesis
MTSPKRTWKIDVSIVVCTLNEEKNVVNCMKALRAQEFSGKYEIILADGNSEDKTVKLAKPFVDKTVIEKRRSIAFERHAGAQVARGKIIAFTDCDSETPKDWVQKIFDTFEKNPDISMIYGPVFYSDVSKKEQALASFFMPRFLRIMNVLKMDNPVGSNIAIRKEVYDAIGGFDTKYVTCEDLDLGKRAKKHGDLHYDKHLHQFVSARKVRKWGYLKYIGFHLVNGIRYHITGKAAKKYEDVRE